MNANQTRAAAAGMLLLATVGLSACSGSSAGSDATKGNTSQQNEFSAQGLVGSGCAAYAAQVPSGTGSISGMAQDPLATAASHNPMLTQLTAALTGKLNSHVNLANTLNGQEYTVFAPVDSAFQKLPASTLANLKTSQQDLVSLLTYHVLAGQIAPTAIAGKQLTVEGATVDVTGSGDNLKVNGAKVICGGVKTANATVYLIDSVLTPPKN